MASNYRIALQIQERNKEARKAEHDGDLKKAVRLYEDNIKEDKADKFAFERLMVIYRGQKEYKNELRVINRGIDLFRREMEKHVSHSLSRRVDSKKLKHLSQAIIKKSGLEKDELHFPDPIDKWLKRKKIVEEKLGK